MSLVHVLRQYQAGYRFEIPNYDAYQTLLTQTQSYVSSEELDELSAPLTVVEFYLDTTDCALLRSGYTLVASEHEQGVRLRFTEQISQLRGKVHTTVAKGDTINGVVPSWPVALQPQRWPKELNDIRKRLSPKRPLCLLARIHRTTHLRALPITGEATEQRIGKLAVEKLAILPPPITIEDTYLSGEPFATLYMATVTPPAGEKRLMKAEVRALYKTFRTMAPITYQTDSILSMVLRKLSAYPTAFSNVYASAKQKQSTNVRVAGEREPIPAGIQPTMSVTDACRLIWQQQLIEMLCNEAGVRYSRDIEYVHEMRVAIRRARAAFTLYRDYFPRKVLRPYRTLLQKTGRWLGAVRDLDVLIEKSRRASKQNKGTQSTTALLTAWEAERIAAHQELLSWLNSNEYRTLLADFLAFCQTNESPQTMPQEEVRHIVPTRLMKRFANVRRYETLFDAPEVVPYATIHELRIDCKYLRYSLEFVRSLLGTEGEALILQLKHLQELLGDLNDAVVALERLHPPSEDEAKHGHKSKKQKKRKATSNTADYRQEQQAVLRHLMAKVPVALAHFVDYENRKALALAIAHL